MRFCLLLFVCFQVGMFLYVLSACGVYDCMLHGGWRSEKNTSCPILALSILAPSNFCIVVVCLHFLTIDISHQVFL